MIRVLVFALAIWPSLTWACRTDRDCVAPDECHFRSGEPEGLCLNTRTLTIDRTTALVRPLGQRKAGDACQFSVDCAPGSGCFKRPGAVEGQCFPPPAPPQ